MNKETAAFGPTNSPTPGTASVLNNAVNPRIKNSTFNVFSSTNFSAGTGQVLDVLYGRVAPHAILNAGGRADKVRCHPGTREEVISCIERWRDTEAGTTAPIFWLSGPAGAGKTAIVQTIAERCKVQRVPHTSFFFFRTDTSRNTLSPLVATLLHQAVLLYPPLRDLVATVLSANPLLFDSILEEQLEQLLVAPLRDIQHASSSYRPLTLLIDGLDECDSENKHLQQQIVHAFDKFVGEHPCPFRLLVASRDEFQIRMAFNQISSPLLPLHLDDQYSPDMDIRVYVNDQFEHIRRTHPLAYTLNATWPSAKDVEGIVEKSSGQFIYAATVMRFISDSSASPALSLERVQGAARIATKSPFSHLDAIYSYILSQVDDQDTLKDILHAQLLIKDGSKDEDSRHMPTVNVAQLLGASNPIYTTPMIHSCLSDLTSIVRNTDTGDILFYHASFPDYLLDRSRSRDYFVDINAYNFKILSAVWKRITLGVQVIAFSGLRKLRKLPPDFLSTLSALNPSDFSQLGRMGAIKVAFQLIYDLCACEDDLTNYKKILRAWINTLDDDNVYHPVHRAEHPPCSRRYFMMARIARDITIKPTDNIAIALRSGSEYDTRETALWLNNLLHRLNEMNSPDPNWIGLYQRRIKQWISCAVWNDIPLDGLYDIPGARWYLWKRAVEKRVTSCLKLGSRKFT